MQNTNNSSVITQTIDIDLIVRHCRDQYEFMAGISRDHRQDTTHEFFTPSELVRQGLDKFNADSWLPEKTFLDNSCGDGQILSEVLIRKMEKVLERNGQLTQQDLAQALSTIYGVDLMADNVRRCQDRLLCGHEHLRPIVEQNIVCADGLRYHYRFDGTDPYSTEADLRLNQFIEFL